ncbi:MAG: hypothetical protein HY070_10235 [Chloroflexi bacterium]|nr:hypothetical protein [Chloroflexota bacterium]
MKHLDSAEQAAFIGGMLTRVLSASVSDNWSAVSDWVEEWKATANIYADPQATHAVKVGKKELANSNWVDWLSLKKELGL